MTIGLLIRDAGNVQRTISELVIRDAGNTPRTISELWIRDLNNVSRLVFNPSGSATLSATVDPTNVIGVAAGTGTATTDTTTVTATGGTAPYTYLWILQTYTSGAAAPTADSPTADTTSFTQTSIPTPLGIEGATWICRVTDSLGNTADSDLLYCTFVDQL